jgi:hypothetical protein
MGGCGSAVAAAAGEVSSVLRIEERGDVTKAKAEAACPGCGFAAGRQACQDLFNDAALRVRALAWTGSLATWRLMHDVYAIQHVEDRCTGYGQFVMHLGGVCVHSGFGSIRAQIIICITSILMVIMASISVGGMSGWELHMPNML